MPTSLNYLIPRVKLNFGDLYSDEIILESLVNAVYYSQKYWNSRYQVFTSGIINQTVPAPSGYIAVNSSDGVAIVPEDISVNDVFRNPYVTFSQDEPPTVQTVDEEGLVLTAVFLLRRLQVTNSFDAFTSWRTEDVQYSGIAAGNNLNNLLRNDEAAMKEFFRKAIGKPIRSSFGAVTVLKP